MFNKPIKISWHWQLNSSPEKIWPLISDTNRLFKDINQPSVQETDITKTVEAGFAQLSYNGIKRYEIWEEEPYEWEYPFRFGVVRHYQAGSYKDLKLQVDLKPNPEGTRLSFKFWATPRLNIMSALATLKLKTIVKGRLTKTVREYDHLVTESKSSFQSSSKNQLVRGGKKRLNQILEQLHNSEVDGAILERIVNFIKKADDLELKRIRPYKLADNWGYERRSVLNVFIYAAKAGLLNFAWDLYCPQCRTIQHSVKTLNQIHEPIFCQNCEEEFSVNFNKTIELSFSPHPLIRKIKGEQFCNRGPQSRPHIVIQQYLKPGEKKFLKTNLPAGAYTLKTNQTKGSATLIVAEDGNETIHIALHNKGFEGERIRINSEPNLSFENKTDSPQLFTLEQKEWTNDGVSAAEATSSQLFRSTFADEVLRKGEKISADNLTLMFTDLFDSTGMYHKKGDNKAVGHVIDHFEVLQNAIAKHNGAIVKTIGDSVMAVFCTPDRALQAYLKAQNMLSSDPRFSNNLQLKAGIHRGSCVAANLNSRIDYFGSTVNIASRFVDMADENEVVISENIFSDNKLEHILQDSDHNTTINSSSTRLKGFDSKYFPVKHIKIDGSPLQLAM